MNSPNWRNRTLFHGDNLTFLRAMNSETVDLIATDPPFNKGRDFHATPDSLAAGARFQDRWSWEDDVHDDWCQRREEKSHFRHDKMSHFQRVKVSLFRHDRGQQCGWLPLSSLVVLLLYRGIEDTGLALGLEPVALALDVDRR